MNLQDMKRENERELTKTDKVVVAIIMIVLFALMWLTGCSTEEKLRVSGNTEFSVRSVDGGCRNEMYLIAIVDENDAFEWAEDFNCSGISGNGNLKAGMILELRCYSTKEFDKTMLFNYSITFNGVDHNFKDVPYTGIKLLLE